MRRILYKKIISLLILFFCFANVSAQNADTVEQKSVPQGSDKLSIERPKYAPLIAFGEVVLINAVVHAFDRFVTNEEFARVNWKDIGNNFKNGFVWDNSRFSTNTFYHPYHGGLYFNAARANGLSFWQSIPYTFAGSFMWEFMCENNDPAINDFIATSIGGIALGEITHRLSQLVLDDSKSGWNRARREILAGLISPMDAFNRLIWGKTKHHAGENEKQNYLRENFHINLSIMSRFINDLENKKNKSAMSFGVTALYGEPFTVKEKRMPYDFFVADFNFNIIGNQPFVADASIIGSLWGKNLEKGENSYFGGIFQHFDYYNSKSLTGNKKDSVPYEFAETASFGGGFYVKKEKEEDGRRVYYGSIHANLILLGASESDYYSVYHRNYNFGSGYSVKLMAMVDFLKYFNVFVNLKTYQIFTNHEDPDDDYDTIYDEYNVPGNNGNTLFNIFSGGINYKITEDLSLGIEQRFYLRRSHYRYFKDVSTTSTETQIKLTYTFFD